MTTKPYWGMLGLSFVLLGIFLSSGAVLSPIDDHTFLSAQNNSEIHLHIYPHAGRMMPAAALEFSLLSFIGYLSPPFFAWIQAAKLILLLHLSFSMFQQLCPPRAPILTLFVILSPGVCVAAHRLHVAELNQALILLVFWHILSNRAFPNLPWIPMFLMSLVFVFSKEPSFAMLGAALLATRITNLKLTDPQKKIAQCLGISTLLFLTAYLYLRLSTPPKKLYFDQGDPGLQHMKNLLLQILYDLPAYAGLLGALFFHPNQFYKHRDFFLCLILGGFLPIVYFILGISAPYYLLPSIPFALALLIWIPKKIFTPLCILCSLEVWPLSIHLFSWWYNLSRGFHFALQTLPEGTKTVFIPELKERDREFLQAFKIFRPGVELETIHGRTCPEKSEVFLYTPFQPLRPDSDSCPCHVQRFAPFHIPDYSLKNWLRNQFSSSGKADHKPASWQIMYYAKP